MAKKLQCIMNLKNKLKEMQKDLERIQAEPLTYNRQSYESEKQSFNKTMPLGNFNSIAASPTLTKSPTWKNPTFWGSNPILGRQTSPQTVSKWAKEKSPRIIKQNLEPLKQQIKKFVDENYYDHTTPQKRGHLRQQIEKRPSQRFLYSFQNNQRETPRFEKIKTYDHPISNPILNPELPKETGKKIVIKMPTSPNSNLIENPKSNPAMYFFRDKMTALSPKNSNAKNLSPQMRQLLSSSVEQKICSPPRKSSKKHYSRYFKQTYQCKWN